MKNTLFALIMSGALAVTSFGQIAQRERNQQHRIANGIRTGRLTPNETVHLESRERNINREVHDDRETHNGRLTSGERAHINNQQNRLSNAIYRDKHN